jgi:hypothetical protein
MMKNKTKKEVKRILIKFIKFAMIIAIIYLIYSSGRVRGMVDGISMAEQRHNSSMCDFLNKERGTDGFCILNEEVAKYTQYGDCHWEKFKVVGNGTRPPLIVKIKWSAQNWVTYPFLGC